MNEEKIYRKLKENIRMIKSQRSYMERNKLIKNGKRMGIGTIIEQNERINNNLCINILQTYKAILSYCLKCKRYTE